MASPRARGPGKNKRQWNEEEDDALIEAVKDIVSSGAFKADNGFKPGFLMAVEEKLKSKLPNSGLKAQPHINSRLRHFKSVHAIVYDMLAGPNTSGFGWDPDIKTVTASRDVWKEYLKSHPKASEFRNKPCPHYEDLCIIFGKDRATGNEARGFQECEDEINEEENREKDNESSSTHEGNSLSRATSSGKGKRARSNDDMFKNLSEVASILGRDIKAASSELSHAIGHDAVLSEKRARINDEVSKLGFEMRERHRATRKIASEVELVDIFFSIPEIERKEWVQALLSGDI